jgi:hypothetical protein
MHDTWREIVEGIYAPYTHGVYVRDKYLKNILGKEYIESDRYRGQKKRQ